MMEKTAGTATTQMFFSMLMPSRTQRPRTMKVSTRPTAAHPAARKIYSRNMRLPAIGNIQLPAYLSGQVIVNFPVPGNRGRMPVFWIKVDRMLGALAEQNATFPCQVPDKFTALQGLHLH